MNFKYLYIVVYSTAFYVLYTSNNSYVKFVKEYLFTNLENLYDITFLHSNTPATILHDGSILFTAEELSTFSSVEKGLYLSILGKVYDVTNGAKFYGPGSAYNAFVGRDASLAFITGDFSDTGLTDDLSSLSDKQIMQLTEWATFYDTTYIYKGKLLGRYYDHFGNPTNERKKVMERSKQGERLKREEEQKNTMFPPCNIEWNADTGTRVWCTKNSGGISRDWTGVPRILFEKPNSKQNRCACVNINSAEYRKNEQKFGLYENCPISATSCNVKIPDT